MLHGPMLITERLILRPPVADDFEAFAAMYAEADTMQHLGGAVPKSVAWRAFASIAGAWQLYGYSMFSVIERQSGEWLGRVGPWNPDGWPAPEIAYGLRSQYAGKGYAREAAVAAIDFAVDFLGWQEISHTIKSENTASVALAQKLGAVNQGPTQLPAPFEKSALDLWSQSAANWKANRANFPR